MQCDDTESNLSFPGASATQGAYLCPTSDWSGLSHSCTTQGSVKLERLQSLLKLASSTFLACQEVPWPRSVHCRHPMRLSRDNQPRTRVSTRRVGPFWCCVVQLCSHRLNMTCSERHVAAFWAFGASSGQAHPPDISETDGCAAHVRAALQLPYERALVCSSALSIRSSHTLRQRSWFLAVSLHGHALNKC